MATKPFKIGEVIKVGRAVRLHESFGTHKTLKGGDRCRIVYFHPAPVPEASGGAWVTLAPWSPRPYKHPVIAIESVSILWIDGGDPAAPPPRIYEVEGDTCVRRQ